MRRFPALNLWSYRAWQWAAEGSFGMAVVRPGWQRSLLSWLCRAHLRYGVRDPDLRRRFTPPDQPMCKRLIAGTGFYQLFEQGSATLVDTPIDHVAERGIVTADGELHELDVIVLATGFDAHRFLLPIELTGVDGGRLSELWAREPFGYRTVAIPGFPNVFTLIGPHSPFGNQSLFTISEVQADFALRCIERWRHRSFDAMWPTREAADQFNDDLRSVIPQTIWASGCKSWYLGADGIPSVWPGSRRTTVRSCRSLRSATGSSRKPGRDCVAHRCGRAQRVVSADRDHFSQRRLGRWHPERVALALNHQRRHGDGIELAQAALLGPSRRMNRERKAQDRRRTGVRRRPARDPCARGAAAADQLEARQRIVPQRLYDREPCCVQLRRRRRRAPAGDAIGLLDEHDR